MSTSRLSSFLCCFWDVDRCLMMVVVYGHINAHINTHTHTNTHQESIVGRLPGEWAVYELLNPFKAVPIACWKCHFVSVCVYVYLFSMLYPFHLMPSHQPLSHSHSLNDISNYIVCLKDVFAWLYGPLEIFVRVTECCSHSSDIRKLLTLRLLLLEGG